MRPRRAEPRPVVVFLYGGGWNSGRKEQYRFVAETLTGAGFVVAIPDYRVVPEAHFPDFVADSAAAVAWVHANIARLGGDPEPHRAARPLGGRVQRRDARARSAVPARPRARDQRARRRGGDLGALRFPAAAQPAHDRRVRARREPAGDPAARARARRRPAAAADQRQRRPAGAAARRRRARRARARGGRRARAIVYDGVGHIDIMAGLSTVLRGESPLLGDITGVHRAAARVPVAIAKGGATSACPGARNPV